MYEKEMFNKVANYNSLIKIKLNNDDKSRSRYKLLNENIKENSFSEGWQTFYRNHLIESIKSTIIPFLLVLVKKSKILTKIRYFSSK